MSMTSNLEQRQGTITRNYSQAGSSSPEAAIDTIEVVRKIRETLELHDIPMSFFCEKILNIRWTIAQCLFARPKSWFQLGHDDRIMYRKMVDWLRNSFKNVPILKLLQNNPELEASLAGALNSSQTDHLLQPTTDGSLTQPNFPLTVRPSSSLTVYPSSKTTTSAMETVFPVPTETNSTKRKFSDEAELDSQLKQPRLSKNDSLTIDNSETLLSNGSHNETASSSVLSSNSNKVGSGRRKKQPPHRLKTDPASSSNASVSSPSSHWSNSSGLDADLDCLRTEQADQLDQPKTLTSTIDDWAF